MALGHIVVQAAFDIRCVSLSSEVRRCYRLEPYLPSLTLHCHNHLKMPYTEDERAIFQQAEHLDPQQRFDASPYQRQRLGRFTMVCLILNRTIGSGIYVTPARILAGTGSVGGSLLFWAAGAIISTCGLFVWLECSMSIPQRPVHGHAEPRGVPRSGGEKNYLEFMFRDPQSRKSRVTCSYGIMFILLGNLSGNAIAFGLYFLEAIGQYDPIPRTLSGVAQQPHHGAVIGLAIAAQTLAALLHVCSRRGGIFISNSFAVIKVVILIVLICLGAAKAGGAFPSGINDPHNFATSTSFSTRRHDVASYSDSLLFIIYTFSGFEQPFYVLSEFKNPRITFPRWTVCAMGITVSLFMLMNISYLFAVNKQAVLDNPNIDMATVFFEGLFGTESGARRAMAALIAFSILGNIVVMTFTAARVKQELAKEGILSKYSLFFATSHTTPFAWLWHKFGPAESDEKRDRLEQAPIAALGLHWCTSVFLILITIPAKPTTAYSILVNLYSYTIIIIVGVWVSFGLLLTKLRTAKFHWKDRRRYRPPISPAHAIVYFLACCFVLICALLPPSSGSPYAPKVTGLKWYIVPTIGLSSPLWGVLWYYGLLAYERWIKWELIVDREPYWIPDPDNAEEYVQRAEVVTHRWKPRELNSEQTEHPPSSDIDDQSVSGRDADIVVPNQTSRTETRPNTDPSTYIGRLVGVNLSRGRRSLDGDEAQGPVQSYEMQNHRGR